MFRLRDLRNLKKQYELRDFEWLFIACLKGGIELVMAEGPEAALSKSLNRDFMAEDVESALEMLPERTVALMRSVVMKDMTLKQAGAKWGITAERVRVLLVRDFRRMCAEAQQVRLTGAYRLREVKCAMINIARLITIVLLYSICRLGHTTVCAGQRFIIIVILWTGANIGVVNRKKHLPMNW